VRKRTIRSGFATRQDAEKELRIVLRQQDAGTYASVGRALTFGELADDWLEHVEDRVHALTLKQRSFEGYRSHIRTHIEPHLIASIPITSLARNHVRNFYRDLRDGGMSPATLHRVHATVRAALNWAVLEDVIPSNPAKGVHRAPRSTSKAAAMPWTEDETANFLAHPAVAVDDLRAAWWVLANTGMRRSELLALKWSDLDTEERRLRIGGAVVRSTDRGLMVNGTKNWESRTVTIPDTVIAELERHRLGQERHKQWVARDSWEDHDLIFPSATGGLRDPDAVTRRFGRLVRAAGARRIRLHDLRHGHASHLIRRGATPVLVQKRLGHKNIEVTLGVYSHLWSHDEISAVDELAAVIAGG
jgi:integrase